tara:strand:- start:2010 stop:2357 length:348 start_codon:yes stop_codon:yes gene_type:complete
MKPYEQFLFFYKDNDALEVLQECTHCYYDHEVFVCGYPTNSNYITKKTNKKLDKADTWYVMFAAGNLIKAFDKFEEYEFLCFHREDKHNKLKLVNYKRLRDLYGKTKTTQTTYTS